MDENREVPPLAGEDVSDAEFDAEQGRQPAGGNDSDPDAIDVDKAPVKMVVLDGIVMGPTVSLLTFVINELVIYFFFNSIVLLVDAYLIWIIHEGVYFAVFTTLSMAQNAVCRVAII
jgi:hypothetical protein